MINLRVHVDEMLSGHYFVDVRISELEGGIGRAQSIYRATDHVDGRKWAEDNPAEGAVLAAFELLRKVWSDRPF